MAANQKEPHLYPMKKHWQTINRILGFWAWIIVFASIIGSLFLILIFQWPRKVLPAFRKVMAGEASSYLRISPDGLVYHSWPWGELICTWQDVHRLRKSRCLGDALTLRQVRSSGFWEFSDLVGQQQVHLSSLDGWADGRIESDLHKYAPHLFRM